MADGFEGGLAPERFEVFGKDVGRHESKHVVLEAFDVWIVEREWLLEKRGTKTRRPWRKSHIVVDADSGLIAAATVTSSDVDDASQVGALLNQVDGPITSLTDDGAYDQDGVYGVVAARHRGASILVPPRSSAVPSETAEAALTRRARHLQIIVERGRMAWQNN